MRASEIIRKKRDSGVLTPEEIGFFIKGVTEGSIPDYQASALLMAIYLKGMDMQETVALTRSMLESGTRLDTSRIQGAKVDKHSTGGVGDKTSIILAPLAAVLGLKVPMVSGRGLGHTGGTLDKLECIPGFRTALTEAEAVEQVGTLGVCMMGQTASLAPADRKLYALRDVTATVESIPLIAASIMSKKLAEGLDGLVLDVKCGHGAFMKSTEDARQLAQMLVSIGNTLGVRTVALLTNMDQPLGRTIGNALELKECIGALRGKGAPDLMDLTYNLAAWMVNLEDAISEEEAVPMLVEFARKKYVHEAMEFIDKGDAFTRFLEMVEAQGGDTDAVLNPSRLPTAKKVKQVEAEADGYLRVFNAEGAGRAAMLLGAGRLTAEDSIDPAAGIVVNKKCGDTVKRGDIIALLHYNDEAHLAEAEAELRAAIEIGERPMAARPLVFEVILK